MLGDGLYDIPPGRVASVVTHLEMRDRPAARPVPPQPDLTLSRWHPDAAAYQALFRKVGADWMWFSRLRLSPEELSPILTHPEVEIYVVEKDGAAEGLLELDFREGDACELAYFGLTEALTGSGAGRWLMDHAIARAFAHPITRFHVHTCSIDSPAALPFYMRSGFHPVRQQIEIAQDPRLTGDLPRASAPQVPILEGRE